MFYPELSSVENYRLYSELINELDKWFAFLPIQEQDKISASKVSIKFGIDFDLAGKVLNSCCKVCILEKHLAIRCPECEHIIETATEQNLYDTLLGINSCYACDKDDITISTDDILILYKLIKKPTNSPEKIKELANKVLKDTNESEAEPTLSKYIQDNLSNIHNIFYTPTEEQKQKLITLLDKLTCDFDNTKAQGDSLEDLSKYLLNIVKCFNAEKNIKTPTNQLDVLCINKLDFSPSLFQDIGSFFIVECKNEEEKPDNTYFHKISSIIHLAKGKFGIVFSMQDATKTCSVIAREYFLDEKIIVINITFKDLNKIIKEDYNLLDLIHYKILDVKVNPSKSLENRQLFASQYT